MGDAAVKPTPRRRSGCLKWTCGCLAVTIVVGVALVFMFWHYLNQWDARKSPWEHLPPSTTWAVEAHDLKTLTEQAARDPGFAPLLEILTEAIGGADALSEYFSPGSLASYGNFSWLYRLALPNAFLVGGDYGGTEESWFLIVQPTAWLRLLLSYAPEGAVRRVEDDETELYYAANDGWLIVAATAAAVQRVVDGWNSDAEPLGPKPDRREAYLTLAIAPEPPEPSESPASEPEHFAFADPFAGVPAQTAPPKVLLPSARVYVMPEAAAWRFAGEVTPPEAWAESCAALIGELPEPEPLKTAEYDVAVSIGLDRYALGAILDTAEAAARPVRDASPTLEEQFFAWLGEGWLSYAGDGVTLLAAPPVAKDDAYPALPLGAIRWTIREDWTARDVAPQFARTLEDFLESVREGGGIPLLREASSGLIAHIDIDKGEGSVDLPPVLVSGARPGWRFVDGDPGAAWFVTDTAVLARLPDEGNLPAIGESSRTDGVMDAAGAWVLSEAFRDGLGAWLRDRLEMTPAYAGMDGEERRIVALAGELAATLFAAYPRAAFRARYDAPVDRVVFGGRVPHGNALPRE